MQLKHLDSFVPDISIRVCVKSVSKFVVIYKSVTLNSCMLSFYYIIISDSQFNIYRSQTGTDGVFTPLLTDTKNFRKIHCSSLIKLGFFTSLCQMDNGDEHIQDNPCIDHRAL